MRKMQATFLEHVMRGREMEHLVMTGKPDGNKAEERQREMLDNMTSWLYKENPTQVVSYNINDIQIHDIQQNACHNMATVMFMFFFFIW